MHTHKYIRIKMHSEGNSSELETVFLEIIYILESHRNNTLNILHG